MEILEKHIKECQMCKRYSGWVMEKYNGNVAVYCKCDLNRLVAEKKSWKSPCMICPDGHKLWWTPISNHKEADGKWWHTPYFSVPSINCR